MLFESFGMGVISGVKLVMQSYWMLTKTLNGLLNVGRKKPLSSSHKHVLLINTVGAGLPDGQGDGRIPPAPPPLSPE